jgi:hypothetical protein
MHRRVLIEYPGQDSVLKRILKLNGKDLWSRPSESNRRPFDYESNALPTELGRPVFGTEILNIRFGCWQVKQMTRRGDTETRRHGDAETRRHGDTERLRLSLVTVSPRHRVTASHGLRVATSHSLCRREVDDCESLWPSSFSLTTYVLLALTTARGGRETWILIRLRSPGFPSSDA